MSAPSETLINSAYSAFNGRDIDAILVLMQPDVRWPKGFEGGFVQGHEAVREYWMRQWSEIDPNVVPVGITERPDGRIAVEVQQTVLDLHGQLLIEGRVHHVYTLRDGLIAAMEIETEEATPELS